MPNEIEITLNKLADELEPKDLDELIDYYRKLRVSYGAGQKGPKSKAKETAVPVDLVELIDILPAKPVEKLRRI